MRKKENSFALILMLVAIGTVVVSCSSTTQTVRQENKSIPESFTSSKDSTTVADVNWRDYFADPSLAALIDTALVNNQELSILLQEIEIGKNEVLAREGEYLPFVNVGLGTGLEKEGKHTRHGAVDEQLEIVEGESNPEPLTDYSLTIGVSWELDIWRKLRDAKKASVYRYLASSEGAKFMVTNLVAEIAEKYYELMGLDNLLLTITENVGIQRKALSTAKQQKKAGKATQLAVNRFKAQLFNTQNIQYEIRQQITENENRITFLTGKFSTSIERSSARYIELKVDSLHAGIPSQLLSNRPDIRQAEMNLAAAKMDVQVAKARFFPSMAIKANIGLNALNPAYLLDPESILYNLAGDIVAPLINRNAIEADFRTANSEQLKAVLNYEQSILNGYVDVVNQLAKVENFSKSFDTKSKEVELSNQSVSIANSLFYSARADYTEVLLTQREALDAKIELLEVQAKLLNGKVGVYRALGGGWK